MTQTGFYPEVSAIITEFGCRMILLCEATERATAATTQFSESAQWLDTLIKAEAQEKKAGKE
jgi:hypothetical protein